MAKHEATTHATAAIAVIPNDPDANLTRWNHMKTMLLIVVSLDRHAVSSPDL